MTHRKTTVSTLVLLLPGTAPPALANRVLASPGLLAGDLFPGPEAQRHGLARGPGRAQFLAVDGEHDPRGIADVHVHRPGEGPGLRAPPDHVRLGRNLPFGLVNSTQQSWIAVRLIDTYGFAAGEAGVADGVDDAPAGSVGGWDTRPELAWVRAGCAVVEFTTR